MRRMLAVVTFIGLVLSCHLASAAHLGMGFRVGEVTQNSAIVWARITKTAERNWKGYRDPKKREPRMAEYVPSKIAVADRQGEISGAAGQLRVQYATNKNLTAAMATDWLTVGPKTDFVHQFHLKGLKSGTKYYLKVEARDNHTAPVTAKSTGSFGTPFTKENWQDVSFGVVTGQSYWDLDDPDGYHIYPAMQKLGLDFLVPTGDTVYLDSEAPRARTVELARYHWHRMYSLPRHIELHRDVPGFWEVDDHDTWCNDCWPSMTAKWMNPLTFQQGFDIYREQVPMGKQTYRTVRWGKGLQVWMVEGRLFRDPNNSPDGPDKLIWGKEQRDWLMKTILESDADFRVLISPTPIVGPDRTKGKNDNHSNTSFQHAGDFFRNWTKEKQLKNLYICNGDRHWQYMSIDPKSGLREFSCGPASNKHAGGNPKQDKTIQPWLRVKGGFLSVSVTRKQTTPTIAFRHHDVHGKVVHEYTATSRK